MNIIHIISDIWFVTNLSVFVILCVYLNICITQAKITQTLPNTGSHTESARRPTSYAARPKYGNMCAYVTAEVCNMVMRHIHHKAPAKLTIAICQHNISQHCWAQHAACVWSPCCDMLGVVGPSLSNLSQQHSTRHNMSQ